MSSRTALQEIQQHKAAIMKSFDALIAENKTLYRELGALLRWQRQVTYEYQITICPCGGIVDLKDSQQAESGMCHVCLKDKV